MALDLGFARNFGSVHTGIALKYLNSTLIDQYKATAYAGDAGFQIPFGSRLVIGSAIQNIGTSMKYLDSGDPLPRIARIGASYVLIPTVHPTRLLLDAPYYMNEKQLRPGMGLEVMVGPLA